MYTPPIKPEDKPIDWDDIATSLIGLVIGMAIVGMLMSFAGAW